MVVMRITSEKHSNGNSCSTNLEEEIMKKWKDLSTGNKIFIIIYVCCWIAMGIYGFYKYNYDEKVLNDYKITTATVTRFYRDSKFYNVEIENVITDIKLLVSDKKLS